MSDPDLITTRTFIRQEIQVSKIQDSTVDNETTHQLIQ
jgi:hypothetical protein